MRVPITRPPDDDIVVYSIPMRSKFRGITVREGMLWRGPAGWTEFSPFLDYDAPQSAPWLRAAVEQASEPYPVAVRDAIAVNCTVPAINAESAREVVFSSGGCRTAKVKVAEPGQSLAEDCSRVAAVREALGSRGAIRVDANANWNVEDATWAITALDKAASGLEYVEQPCASVEDLARVRRRVDVRIAADESIRRAEDPYLVARAEAADVAVVKLQPLGGIAATMRIAERIGLPLVVSSALETSVGIGASIALAAALPDLPFACGLNTTKLLVDDATTESLAAVSGYIGVPATRLVPDNLEAVRAPEETRRRWLARLAEVSAQ